MIIKALLEIVTWLMDTLIIFEIPSLPEEIHGYLEIASEYLVVGGGIFANYAPIEFVVSLYSIILAVDAGILIYHLVMWIIKKVPFLGMQ